MPTEFTQEQIESIQRAVKSWTLEKSTSRAVEELQELSLALLHSARGKADVTDILNEMADARIVLKHLELRFGSYQEQLDRKIIKGNT